MRNRKIVTDFTALCGRIGIFGGTFDPVHKAHVKIAGIAREVKNLDAVVFMPDRKNPLKDAAPVAGHEERLEMLLLAVDNESSFFVSDFELRNEQCSFTAETLAAVRNQIPSGSSLYFILGSDSLATLPLWRNVKEIFRLATIVPVARRSFGLERLEDIAPALPAGYVEKLRREFIETPFLDVSSFDIRAKIKNAPPWPLELPEPVRNYIEEKNLYRQ